MSYSPTSPNRPHIPGHEAMPQSVAPNVLPQGDVLSTSEYVAPSRATTDHPVVTEPLVPGKENTLQRQKHPCGPTHRTVEHGGAMATRQTLATPPQETSDHDGCRSDPHPPTSTPDTPPIVIAKEQTGSDDQEPVREAHSPMPPQIISIQQPVAEESDRALSTTNPPIRIVNHEPPAACEPTDDAHDHTKPNEPTDSTQPLPEIYQRHPELIELLPVAHVGKIAVIGVLDSMKKTGPLTPRQITQELAARQDSEVGWRPPQGDVAGWLRLMNKQGYVEAGKTSGGTAYTLTPLGEAALNIGGAIAGAVMRHPEIPLWNFFGKAQTGKAMCPPTLRFAMADALLNTPDQRLTQTQLTAAAFPQYDGTTLEGRRQYKQTSYQIERLVDMGLLALRSRQDGSHNPAFRISVEPEMPEVVTYVSRDFMQVIVDAWKVLWDKDPNGVHTLEDVKAVVTTQTHAGKSAIAGLSPEEWTNAMSAKYGHILKIANDRGWGAERVDDEIGDAQQLTAVGFPDIQTADAFRSLVRRVREAAYDPDQTGRATLRSIVSDPERMSILMEAAAQAQYTSASKQATERSEQMQTTDHETAKALALHSGASRVATRTALRERPDTARTHEQPELTTKPAYVYRATA